MNLLSPKKIQLPNGKMVVEKRSVTPLIIIVLLLFTIVSINITEFKLEVIVKQINRLFVIIDEMIPPNVEYMPSLWQPLLDTIKMSLIGSVLGAICALPVAFFAASNITKNRLITTVVKFLLSLLRTLPTLVVALIATYVFGLGTMAGTIAIYLFTVSYVGKLLYEQIENANMDSYEAMQSLGLTSMYSFRYAIMPQVIPNYLSTTLFCFEGNVRYAAILGYVGAGGIGLMINESIGWRNYANLGMIILMLVVTVFIIETISEYCRKKLM
ncbi:phosphonate ABC transporter, permease protein PhnE [Ureibacillus manganicus]|uniref:Phosphonate ABC transporter permease n=1 Tax=Ureibacillus manganicus DSM 26584 TaxID=1384049 RepID=A0A0A3I9G7_9BACL|nr:phosphonate ABC transporter, permease protein PhnE [Ureibacillus manganicus]KGR79428.1 phosphonate ABC transporter permease [Ureibacillus manganicus DSM 26584]